MRSTLWRTLKEAEQVVRSAANLPHEFQRAGLAGTPLPHAVLDDVAAKHRLADALHRLTTPSAKLWHYTKLILFGLLCSAGSVAVWVDWEAGHTPVFNCKPDSSAFHHLRKRK